CRRVLRRSAPDRGAGGAACAMKRGALLAVTLVLLAILNLLVYSLYASGRDTVLRALDERLAALGRPTAPLLAAAPGAGRDPPPASSRRESRPGGRVFLRLSVPRPPRRPPRPRPPPHPPPHRGAARAPRARQKGLGRRRLLGPEGKDRRGFLPGPGPRR